MLELSKTEMDILSHRLEVPDAIAECLDGYHPEDIDAVCDRLAKGDIKGSLEIGERITYEVLADAIEGSTYLACANGALDDGDITRQKHAGLERAAQSLASKIGKLVGRRLTVPAI